MICAKHFFCTFFVWGYRRQFVFVWGYRRHFFCWGLPSAKIVGSYRRQNFFVGGYRRFFLLRDTVGKTFFVEGYRLQERCRGVLSAFFCSGLPSAKHFLLNIFLLGVTVGNLFLLGVTVGNFLLGVTVCKKCWGLPSVNIFCWGLPSGFVFC